MRVPFHERNMSRCPRCDAVLPDLDTPHECPMDQPSRTTHDAAPRVAPRTCSRCRVGAHDHCQCQCDVCRRAYASHDEREMIKKIVAWLHAGSNESATRQIADAIERGLWKGKEE